MTGDISLSRPPSQAVIEAVEQAESRHRYLTHGECSCGYLSLDYEGWRSHHRRFEVARAAEEAALRAAAERMDDLSRGAPLAAAITARSAAIRLDHWADELTDETGEQ